MRFWHNRISLRNALFTSLSLLLTGILLTGCAGSVSQPKGWSGATVSNGILYIGSMTGQLEAIDLATHTKSWGKPLEPSHPPAIYGTPTVGQNDVYVSGYNGKIYAYRPNGDFHGTFDTTSAQAIVGSTLVALGNVYFGSSDGKVYAIKADTMQKLWQFPTEGNIGKTWSTPVADSSTIYVTSMDKKLWALDANTGNKKWDFPTDGALVASPVIYKNTIYFGSIDRHVYAVNAQDGTLKWKSKAPAKGWFWTSVVINNDVIYAPSLDGKVYILNAATGDSVADPVTLDSPPSSQPVVAGDAVIVASEAGHVYAIDTTNYQKRELNNLEQAINAPLAASGGSIFVHTSDDTLSALDASTGIVQWKLSLKQ